MKTTILIALIFSSICIYAQPNAKQILLKADSATAQLQTARYYARFMLQPAGGGKLITTEGKVIFKRISDTGDVLGAKVYIEGSFPIKDGN